MGHIREEFVANTYISLYVHYVFSTTQRLPLIKPEIQKRLWAYMSEIAQRHNMKALSIGGTEDHVHILLSLPATVSISKAIQLIKGASSKWVSESFEGFKEFAWQEGYGAFSVSVSALEDVISYIEHQAVHHQKRSFKDEYLKFLDKHGVKYDEKYV